MPTSNKEIQQVSSIKFLGILLYENLTWKDKIIVKEKKISKNLDLFYKAKRILNANAINCFYFSFIHTYLNYGNIVRASSVQTKLEKLASKRKQSIKMIDNECDDIRKKCLK